MKIDKFLGDLTDISANTNHRLEERVRDRVQWMNFSRDVV